MPEKPACEGGTPVRQEYLVFGKPEATEKEIEEVIDSLRSGWWSTGPKVKRFEEEFAARTGAKHALALNSCTAGLHLALVVNGIGRGDEVILPAMTFASTANVVVHAGATPVFADIQADTYNLDPEDVERRITPRTKAIIPVHFAGLPADMAELDALAGKHCLVVIEDAAHAIGASYRGTPVGSGENIACFSFYATKNLAIGEGGMVTIDDDALAERLRVLSLHGLSADAWKRYSKDGRKTYQVVAPGYKYNMQDLNAAIGFRQLARIDEVNATRKRYAERYNRAFAGFDLLEVPPDREDRENAWHLYPVLLNLESLGITRDGFLDALQAENIGCGVHFSPLHLQPYYRETYGYREGSLPRTERVGERTVSLPLQTTMSEGDVDDVVRAVKRILEYYRK